MVNVVVGREAMGGLGVLGGVGRAKGVRVIVTWRVVVRFAEFF